MDGVVYAQKKQNFSISISNYVSQAYWWLFRIIILQTYSIIRKGTFSKFIVHVFQVVSHYLISI